MRGTLWLVLISLPVAMLVAVGLFLIAVAVCARVVPASPFDDLIGLGMAAVMVPEAKTELREAWQRLRGATVLWLTPMGTFASLLGGLVGGALSRDVHRSWFALVPLLTVWALPLRAAPWTLLVPTVWVAAAVVGALLVRARGPRPHVCAESDAEG